MKKRLSSYSAKLIYIFLIAALLTVTILLWIQNNSIYKKQQEEISAIRQALEQLETYAENKEFDEDGKPYIHIELEQPKTNYESVESLTDVLNIVQNQNAQTSRDLSSQITMFAIIISIVTLVIPVLNYTFLQKDQLIKIDNQYKGLNKKSINQYKELKEKMKKSFNQYNELKGKMEKSIEQYKELKEKMEKSIDQSTDVAAAVANPKSESPEIKPISDTVEDRARALYIQATLSINRNKYEKTISLLNKAIELESDNARYYNLRGVALHNLERYEEALKDVSKAIELEPGNAEYYNSRGAMLNNLKRCEEALKDCNKAIGLEPDKAKYYDDRGATLSILERYQEALLDCDKAIELKPNIANYYNHRGAMLHNLERYLEALKDVSRAIELEPKNAEYYNNRGIMLQYLERYLEALKDSNKAIELEPSNAEYYNSRGSIYYSLKQYNDAFKDEERAVELKPSDKFKYDMGITLCRLKRYQEAVDIFNDISGYEESNYYHYRGFAKLGLAQSEGEPIPDEVWQDFDKAIELEPDDYMNYKYKAEAYLMIGKPEHAKPLLDKANELEPQEPNTHHLYALYYEQMGDYKKAEEYHELADKYGYIPEPEIEDDKESD